MTSTPDPATLSTAPAILRSLVEGRNHDRNRHGASLARMPGSCSGRIDGSRSSAGTDSGAVSIDCPEAFAYHSPVTRSSDDQSNPAAPPADSPARADSSEAFSSTSAPAYAAAGVDLDHDEAFIDDVKEIAKGTFRPEVLSSIGGFAGMFKAPDRYQGSDLRSRDGRRRDQAQAGRADRSLRHDRNRLRSDGGE